MGHPLASPQPRRYGGRPAEERRSERREHWLAAGLELFGTVGFRGTSLRALACESGVAERYFAESFADLDDLFAAVHQRLHEEMTAAVRSAVRSAGPDVGERARRGLGALVEGFDDDPRRARIKLVEALLAGPRAVTAMRAGRQELAGLLIAGVDRTGLSAGIDARLLGQALEGGVFELLREWHLGRLDLSRDELVEHCAVLVAAVHRGLSRV
jgi:AcrR family transcriptional regulator